MKKFGLRRYPKVLSDELARAFRIIDRLGHDIALGLLKKYRRNRRLRIAAWGISNIGAPVDGLEQIPFEYVDEIGKLDTAFSKLHHYRNGGAADYTAADVERKISRIRSKTKRKPKNNDDEIIDYLNKHGYATSDNKKAIISDAAAYFSTTGRTIYRAMERKKSTDT